MMTVVVRDTGYKKYFNNASVLHWVDFCKVVNQNARRRLNMWEVGYKMRAVQIGEVTQMESDRKWKNTNVFLTGRKRFFMITDVHLSWRKEWCSVVVETPVWHWNVYIH